MEAGIVEEPEPLPAGRGYAFDAVLSVPALNPEGARHTPRSRAADRDGASRPSRHELTDGRRGSAEHPFTEDLTPAQGRSIA